MRETKRHDSGARLGRLMRILILLTAVGLSGAIGSLTAGDGGDPGEHEITVVARQYAYDPAVIRVNRGDTVRLRFASLDVVHGFYLEGYDLDVTVVPMRSLVEVRRPSRPGIRAHQEEVTFTADKSGKFRFRCSQTCGFMHPFMLGELIVGPNRLHRASMGMAVGILLGGFLVALLPESSE
jgi:heme/copper-type cytochrome/quinol oxidase subunit 2